MAKVVSIQVLQLLDMVENKAFGFGLTYYPESNGADGVIRVEDNVNKPTWRPTGPFNSKGKGVEIKHIEVKRGNIILNNSHVYDRAGFIAVAAPILNDPVEDIEDQALTAADVFNAVGASMSETNIRNRNTKIESRAARLAKVKSSKASIGNR